MVSYVSYVNQSYGYYGCSTDNGDFRYDGSPFLTFVPNAAPENRTVTFSLNHDMVVEGQEIVNLQIERTTSISGFEPRFQNVRIIINDSDS